MNVVGAAGMSPTFSGVFGGCDLHALHEVGSHDELDRDRRLCSEIGDTHSEISRRSHDDCYRAGLAQLETTDAVCCDRVGFLCRHCGTHDWLTRRTSDDGAGYQRLGLRCGGTLGRSNSNNHKRQEHEKTARSDSANPTSHHILPSCSSARSSFGGLNRARMMTAMLRARTRHVRTSAVPHNAVPPSIRPITTMSHNGR